MAAARVQTSARPLQLDALAERQPAALDELIELTRVERLVEGEGHDGLVFAGPSADRHAADVDAPLAEHGPDRAAHARRVDVAQKEHVGRRTDVDVFAEDPHEPRLVLGTERGARDRHLAPGAERRHGDEPGEVPVSYTHLT